MSNDDDARSVGSSGSFGPPVSSGARSRNPYANSDDGSYTGNAPGTPRSGFTAFTSNNYIDYVSEGPKEDEWVEISRDQVYITSIEDVGRKLKVEAAAYSLETGELLMMRVVKTDLVLSRAPDPVKRNLVTAKGSVPGGGARFRIATYNVLAEIYATQQQYPYCDFWALSWDYR